MTHEQLDLLHRIFVVNEQIVKQNLQIMMVLTEPRIGKFKVWNELSQDEIEFGLTTSNFAFFLRFPTPPMQGVMFLYVS